MFANPEAQRAVPEAATASSPVVLLPERTPSSPEQQLAAAVSAGDLSEAKRLLSTGADPNSPELAERPILHRAVESRNMTMTEVLIEHGARVNSKDAAMGSTPIMVAGATEDSEMMRLLILAGANIAARDSEGDGVSAYPSAESRERIDTFLGDEARRRSVMSEAAAVGRRRTLGSEPIPDARTESHSAASAAATASAANAATFAPASSPAAVALTAAAKPPSSAHTAQPAASAASTARSERLPSERSSWWRWLLCSCCCSEPQHPRAKTARLTFDSIDATSSKVHVSERSA